MDLREKHVNGNYIANRHPWELSRTKQVLKVFGDYIGRIGEPGEARRYVNVGAGDLYFDNYLLEKYPLERGYAVDLEYDDSVPDYPQIEKFHYLSEVPDGMDYAIMMDSLEYMPDDVAYVKELSKKVKRGGYFFFTLPAFPSLFSDHDRIVKNLRRYDMKSFRKLIKAVPELEIVEEQYFYTTLLLVRFMQLHLRLKIDEKVTTDWKHSEKSFATRIIVWTLNVDFMISRMLKKLGIKIPGLSMFVICRKKALREG